MHRVLPAILFLLLSPAWAVPAQQPNQDWEPFHDLKQQKEPEPSSQVLTNDSIVKLVKAGLGTDMITNMVNTQPGKYSLGADDIIALKQAGVPEKIIAAMLEKSPSAAALAPSIPPSDTVTEVGVYIKNSNGWTQVMPEVVNW